MKQAYKIFLFLKLALLLVCSVAMAGETKQYNKDPIIKFFKMGQSEMTTLIAPTNAHKGYWREINQLYALLTWIGVGIMAIVEYLKNEFDLGMARWYSKEFLGFLSDCHYSKA